jgi:hypothetical protein
MMRFWIYVKSAGLKCNGCNETVVFVSLAMLCFRPSIPMQTDTRFTGQSLGEDDWYWFRPRWYDFCAPAYFGIAGDAIHRGTRSIFSISWGKVSRPRRWTFGGTPQSPNLFGESSVLSCSALGVIVSLLSSFPAIS